MAPVAELERTDFAAFRACADLPAAMTAHVVFETVDRDRPASASARVITDVVRGAIGFSGLLMSDDLGMRALEGTVAERARAVLSAGCDLALLCSGNLADTEAVAAVAPQLGGAALARFERAHATIGRRQSFDIVEAEGCLAQALRA